MIADLEKFFTNFERKKFIYILSSVKSLVSDSIKQRIKTRKMGYKSNADFLAAMLYFESDKTQRHIRRE